MNKNFTMKELIASDTAKALGIGNYPKTVSVFDNLFNLWYYILQPLRDEMGFKIKVNSGYRSDALNAAVGGAWNSNHLKGRAADITSMEKDKKQRLSDNRMMYNWLLDKANEGELPVEELIWEGGGTWIHVSLRLSQ